MYVRRALVIFILFVSPLIGNAQKGTHSPYSVLGIGELYTAGYATFAGMGGAQMANTDSANVNYLNPAMYSYLERHRPVFQVGLSGRLSRFETSDASVDKRNIGLNRFQIGLPIKKNWGASFGILPYSFSGYQVSNYVVDEDADTTHQYVSEGTGGISVVYLGLAYRPLNFSKRVPKLVTSKTVVDGVTEKKKDTMYVNKSHLLSIGVNGNYLFGSAVRKQSYEYLWPITGYNARVEKALRVSDLNMDLGLNYQYFFRSDSTAGSFSIGASYSPQRSIRAFQDVYAHNYTGSFYEPNRPVVVYDTAQFIQDDQGTLIIPESYKVGIEYRFGPGKGSGSLLRLAADLKYQKWSNYSENFSVGSDTDPLTDRLSMAFGLEYTPATRLGVRSSVTPFLGRIHYRLGFNYTMTEWQVQNDLGNLEQITDYGMSFGLGIPITANFQNTSINFGANFGNLGTTDNGLIRERYIGLYFGLSLTPGRGNYWFVKRKYD